MMDAEGVRYVIRSICELRFCGFKSIYSLAARIVLSVDQSRFQNESDSMGRSQLVEAAEAFCLLQQLSFITFDLCQV